jgi:flotillin
MTFHTFLGEPLLTLSVAAQRRGVSYGGMDDFVVAVALGVGVLFLFIVVIAVVRRFLFICGPQEILVFSGRRTQLRDGSVTNYKIMHGGRGFRKPFVESVRRMDMRLFPVEVTVQNAYSAGGIPLSVRAIANVKLSNDDTKVRNAVERFLDYHPSQIATAAQQTLEGVLREVVSQLTPEEVNEDRLKFAESLMENARDDFDKLGLELDVLKVQHVSDDQEYLANLGRARIANMLRDAENAENAANQAVAEAKAQARQEAETATKQAETSVVQAKNNAQAEVAELDATAKEAENQALMAAETARMVAEQRLQQLRAEMEKLRLHNDVVLPAEAQRKAAELKAAGQAAPAIENGKAGAEALRLVAAEWESGGEQARDVYVLQQLGSLASVAAQRVARSEIGNIKMVANDEAALGAVLAAYPSAVARVLRETASAVGIDIDRLLSRSPSARAIVKPKASHRRTLTPKPPALDAAVSDQVSENKADSGPPTDPLGGPRTARFGGGEEGSPS